ncbi:MAG: hypothetical protein M3R24_42490 [Chloroflexota bacterium]|nr:hypothetical protein [Chloroflexota bacterium]
MQHEYLELVQSGMDYSHGFVGRAARQQTVERLLDEYGGATIERIPLPLDPALYTLVIYDDLSGEPMEVRLDTPDGDYYNIIARVLRRPRAMQPAEACAEHPNRIALALPPTVVEADLFDPVVEKWVLVDTSGPDDHVAVLEAIGFTRIACLHPSRHLAYPGRRDDPIIALGREPGATKKDTRMSTTSTALAPVKTAALTPPSSVQDVQPVEINTLYILSARHCDGSCFGHAFVTETARCESRRRLSDDYVSSIDWELSLRISPKQVMLTLTDDGFLVQIADEHDPLTDEPVIVAQAHRGGDGETLAEAHEDSPQAIIFRIPAGVRMFGADNELLDPASEEFVLAGMRYETDAPVLAALGFEEASPVAMERIRTVVQFTGDSPETHYDPINKVTYPAPPNQYKIVFEHPAGMALTDTWLTEQALAYFEAAGLDDESSCWGELDLGQGHPRFHEHLLAHGVRMLPPAATSDLPPRVWCGSDWICTKKSECSNAGWA